MAAIDQVAQRVALCEALGLDPHGIRSVTIKLQSGDKPNVVAVEYTARWLAEHPEFTEKLATFHLSPNEGG